MELACMGCGRPMERWERGRVRFWSCRCGGYLLSVPSMRRMLPEGMWGEVWPRLREASTRGDRTCPACRNPMRRTAALERVGGHRLDLCHPCDVVWFDGGEYDAMPKRAVPPEVPLERRQAIGRAMAMAMGYEYDLRDEAISAPLRELFESMGGI